MRRAEPALDRAIDRLLEADAPEPDGAVAAQLLREQPRQLDALRLIADVAAGCRRLQAVEAARPPPLFVWGTLAVREQAAAGASADVYRAWDGALGIDVALKLRRDAPESPSARRFLDEARHLARVRQRNIVGIYGAAVHDGRAGLWCEWIDGRPLDAVLREHGPFAPAEAVYVGIELCAALAALHGAGLLHGDLKPGNVLRERGGRIVLVDLGAGGEPRAVNAASAGFATPAYLAPEVLAGAQRTCAQDLYALGRLITTLLSGGADAPLPASTPPVLRRVLARATQAAPEQRYATAVQVQDDLRAALAEIGGGALVPVPRARRGVWIGVLAAAVIAMLGLVAAMQFTARAWHTDLQLLRRTDAGVEPLASGAALHGGDRLLLELESTRPTYAYVLNEDARGELHLLFPLRGLDRTNPLAAGRVRLPGANNGRELSWEAGSDNQREEFLVVLANAPLAPLDRLQDTNAISAIAVERGVRRLRSEPPAGITLAGTHLSALLDELEPLLRDPERARAQAFRFNDAGAR